MYKAMSLLGLLFLVIIFNIWQSGNTDTSIPQTNLSIITPPTPETLGVASDSARYQGWQTYRDTQIGFSFMYPTTMKLEKTTNAIRLSADEVNIIFQVGQLLPQDTVNTIAEKDINFKVDKMGDKFTLLESISPISISSSTGVTYTSLEAEREVTYFYVPVRQSYILITNLTDPSNSSSLNLSDQVIYSVETF